MSESFRVGDRVRFRTNYNHSAKDRSRRVNAGDEGIVSRANGFYSDLVRVDLDKGATGVAVFPHRLEKVQPSPKAGDHIRVTIEGRYRPGTNGPISVGTFGPAERDWDFLSDETDTVTVEVLEPPVEVFQPGDVVRDKDTPSWVYVITEDGYTELPKGRHYNDGAAPSCFTSKEYERVDLG